MKNILSFVLKIYFTDFCFNINEHLLMLFMFWALLLVLALHAKEAPCEL